MILQDPMTALNPVFTVENQVGEAIRIHQKLRGKDLWDSIVDALQEGSNSGAGDARERTTRTSCLVACGSVWSVLSGFRPTRT